VPHLYSDREVEQLLTAARELGGGSFMAHTYTTLFALLAVTGMRVGEAMALDRQDIDWSQGVLILRGCKFGKSREVPLHPTTVEALRDYALRRDQSYPHPRATRFFVSLAGTPLLRQNVHITFQAMARRAGVGCTRIHNLRHTFAVKVLLGWYRAGAAVEAKLPTLSTYLGHVSPLSTYWYLSASPELLACGLNRLEQAMERLP
jgi:integrase